jgi:hypothetical protein
MLCAILLASDAGGADRAPPLPEPFMKDVFEVVMQVKGGAKPDVNQRQPLSLVGRDDLFVEHLYAPRFRPKCEPLERSGKLVDPITEIRDRALSSGRLVIVNEGHDDSQTRAFILSLMTPLHDIGFSVYAAETFYADVGTHAPKWPRLSDGFYSVEPTYGELIRHARALDLAFVPYEEQRADPSTDIHVRIAARETAQSRNIMERIVQGMPAARAIIHVGYTHVSEGPVKWMDGKAIEWMASRLKSASRIDPLTIDQTQFQSPLDRPVVCVVGPETERRLTTDLTVALPAPTLRRGRPAWRFAGGRIEVEVPAAVRAPKVWSIVEARYAGEPSDAVPADRILIGPEETLPLALRPGEYRVEAWTREGGWSASVELTAK